MLWVLLVGTCGVVTWAWGGHQSAKLTFEDAIVVIAKGTDEQRAVAVEVIRRRMQDALDALHRLAEQEPSKVGRAAQRALESLR